MEIATDASSFMKTKNIAQCVELECSHALDVAEALQEMKVMTLTTLKALKQYLAKCGMKVISPSESKMFVLRWENKEKTHTQINGQCLTCLNTNLYRVTK